MHGVLRKIPQTTDNGNCRWKQAHLERGSPKTPSTVCLTMPGRTGSVSQPCFQPTLLTASWNPWRMKSARMSSLSMTACSTDPARKRWNRLQGSSTIAPWNIVPASGCLLLASRMGTPLYRSWSWWIPGGFVSWIDEKKRTGWNCWTKEKSAFPENDGLEYRKSTGLGAWVDHRWKPWLCGNSVQPFPINGELIWILSNELRTASAKGTSGKLWIFRNFPMSIQPGR